MDELFVEIDVTEDEEKEKEIRNRINKWAEKVPYHTLKNYGEELEIERICYQPAYYFELTTQYDRRNIQVELIPYKGESLSEQLYNYPEEVDIWNYECNEPDEFVEIKEVFHVEGSDRVEKCYNCKGQGKLRCPSCNGNTRIRCTNCGGKSSWKCRTCAGRGYENRTCSNCGGTGSYYNHSTNSSQTCSYCKGSKQVTHSCSTCGGSGTERCSTCRGSGTIDCPTCGANGFIACSKCEGCGELKRFYEIHQELAFEINFQLHKHADFEKYYTFFDIELEADNARLITNLEDRYYDIDEFDLPAPFQGYIEELIKLSESSKTQDQAIHKQRLRIWRYDIYDVEYTWKDVDSSLLLDISRGLVFDPHGPIYTKMKGFNDEAEKLSDKKKYSKAIKLNTKAQEMDLGEYYDFITDLQEELSDKILGTYTIGIWVANLPMMGLIYYLFLDFFATPHFYLSELNDLFYKYESFPFIFSHHMGVVFVLASLFSLPEKIEHSLKEGVGKYISHTSLRFITGFIAMVALSIYQAVLLVVINISGLTLISGFSLYGLYEGILWIFQFFN